MDKNRIVRALKNPKLIIIYILQTFFAKHMSDETYIKKIYKLRIGERLHLDNPVTFNEKMTWLKLYDRNPRYPMLADKYEVKKYVADLIGNEYVVDNYGVYDTWEDIDFSKLPNQFVIKGTHDSGGAFVCKDKMTFDFNASRKKIEKNLKTNCFYKSREWPYKDIKPRIIIDKYLDDHTGRQLRDYKFWCFNGVPKFMYCTIKGDNVYENFYDMDFKPVMIDHGFPRHQPEFEKPNEFDEMKKLASKLSVGFPFIRIDFFDVDGHVYFGEFTFYDWGATMPFGGDWDEKLGKYLVLPV